VTRDWSYGDGPPLFGGRPRSAIPAVSCILNSALIFKTQAKSTGRVDLQLASYKPADEVVGDPHQREESQEPHCVEEVVRARFLRRPRGGQRAVDGDRARVGVSLQQHLDRARLAPGRSEADIHDILVADLVVDMAQLARQIRGIAADPRHATRS